MPRSPAHAAPQVWHEHDDYRLRDPGPAGAARPDRRRDRRERGHRARDRATGASRGRRRRPHRPQSRPPAPGRQRTRRAEHGGVRRHRLPSPRAVLPASCRARSTTCMVSGSGPYYAPLAEMDFDEARRDVEGHLWLQLQVARHAAGRVRPGGTLLFIGGTGGRRPAAGSIISTLTAGLPALVKNLALELAPVRVNLIAAGFVDTAAVRVASRRQARRAPRRAPENAADRACGRARRRRRPGRSRDDEHGADRCDVRHRRWPAAPRLRAGDGRLDLDVWFRGRPPRMWVTPASARRRRPRPPGSRRIEDIVKEAGLAS